MSLVLDTGAMKYRESPTDPWRPLVIKAGMNWESMADTYDPDNGTYEVGQYVLEDGMMYRCIYEIATPEAWTPAHWTSANVADELASFIIISDDQPTEDSNKIWIAETTSPFGVQIPTMDDHNALGNTLNQVEDAIAYVQSGDTASRTYTAGQFVYLKNHATLTEGLYTVNDSIPQGNSVTGHLTADASGGLNSLKNSITTKEYRHNYTVSANSDVHWNPITADEVSLSGYTPIGVVAFKTNNAGVTVCHVTTESNDYGIMLKNFTSGSITSVFVYNVLFKKI